MQNVYLSYYYKYIIVLVFLSCYNNYNINMENEVRMKKSKLKKILGFSGVVILIIATFIFFYLKTNSYHPTSEALKI